MGSAEGREMREVKKPISVSAKIAALHMAKFLAKWGGYGTALAVGAITALGEGPIAGITAFAITFGISLALINKAIDATNYLDDKIADLNAPYTGPRILTDHYEAILSRGNKTA